MDPGFFGAVAVKSAIIDSHCLELTEFLENLPSPDVCASEVEEESPSDMSDVVLPAAPPEPYREERLVAAPVFDSAAMLQNLTFHDSIMHTYTNHLEIADTVVNLPYSDENAEVARAEAVRAEKAEAEVKKVTMVVPTRPTIEHDEVCYDATLSRLEILRTGRDRLRQRRSKWKASVAQDVSYVVSTRRQLYLSHKESRSTGTKSASKPAWRGGGVGTGGVPSALALRKAYDQSHKSQSMKLPFKAAVFADMLVKHLARLFLKTLQFEAQATKQKQSFASYCGRKGMLRENFVALRRMVLLHKAEQRWASRTVYDTKRKSFRYWVARTLQQQEDDTQDARAALFYFAVLGKKTLWAWRHRAAWDKLERLVELLRDTDLKRQCLGMWRKMYANSLICKRRLLNAASWGEHDQDRNVASRTKNMDRIWQMQDLKMRIERCQAKAQQLPEYVGHTLLAHSVLEGLGLFSVERAMSRVGKVEEAREETRQEEEEEETSERETNTGIETHAGLTERADQYFERFETPGMGTITVGSNCTPQGSGKLHTVVILGAVEEAVSARKTKEDDSPRSDEGVKIKKVLSFSEVPHTPVSPPVFAPQGVMNNTDLQAALSAADAAVFEFNSKLPSTHSKATPNGSWDTPDTPVVFPIPLSQSVIRRKGAHLRRSLLKRKYSSLPSSREGLLSPSAVQPLSLLPYNEAAHQTALLTVLQRKFNFWKSRLYEIMSYKQAEAYARAKLLGRGWAALVAQQGERRVRVRRRRELLDAAESMVLREYYRKLWEHMGEQKASNMYHERVKGTAWGIWAYRAEQKRSMVTSMPRADKLLKKVFSEAVERWKERIALPTGRDRHDVLMYSLRRWRRLSGKAVSSRSTRAAAADLFRKAKLQERFFKTWALCTEYTVLTRRKLQSGVCKKKAFVTWKQNVATRCRMMPEKMLKYNALKGYMKQWKEKTKSMGKVTFYAPRWSPPEKKLSKDVQDEIKKSEVTAWGLSDDSANTSQSKPPRPPISFDQGRVLLKTAANRRNKVLKEALTYDDATIPPLHPVADTPDALRKRLLNIAKKVNENLRTESQENTLLTSQIEKLQTLYTPAF